MGPFNLDSGYSTCSHARNACVFISLPCRTSPLCVNVHCLCRSRHTVILELVYGDVFANLLLGDDLLVEHSRGALLEPVVPLLRLSGVRGLVIS